VTRFSRREPKLARDDPASSGHLDTNVQLRPPSRLILLCGSADERKANMSVIHK
jgi:hypothetical protein